ncbi:MAG: nicotinate-nucleotide adenylyltransferase [Pelotomaculum sp.]|uniref:Probable nicotinate-nucleotide adenylyltransferase n=1 Tax=Pelotomaculum thermopropionicum (strain DSM 13744 / JCM 10971 / SI) TaxID=370438 RepID=A5D412_PELTS|nr:nicotinate-nucleotide adenylyltransferase [Pelotomaculum sp.]BAF59016.1 nicotinic acid mononucleotide adenylyltransferase [Pelotomaculum thermopropionicum SI]
MRRIGIMGGTFDPIHYGHLVAAEGARYEFGLNRVIFIPAGRPPHKPDCNITDPSHRYKMTCLAVATNPFFQVSALEVERPGPSYTIDTVQEISRLYPDAEVFFITGSDAVMEILTWKNFERLLSICFFIAAARPGYKLNELWKRLVLLPENLKERIFCMEVPALAISSTDIRQRVSEGRPIKYLLPEPVEDYIQKNGLYRQ